ncbi:TonB family protein [candidate division KSB1 bacterium]|nr:TonB family protein [candidate division KSB1 bacterium]
MKPKTYYRSIKKRIEQETQQRKGESEFQAGSGKESQPQETYDFQKPVLQKLPRHLKKGVFGNLDFRFLAILVFSTIFNLLLFYILYNTASFEVTSDDISRMQRHYAKLILNSPSSNTEPGELNSDVHAFDLHPGSKIENEPSPEPPAETAKDLAEKQPRQTRRARADDSESRESGDFNLDNDASAADSKRGALVARVSDMGVLEYMQRTVITSDIDDDFLIYADAVNNNLLRTLDGMDAEDLNKAKSLANEMAEKDQSNRLRKTLDMQRSSGSTNAKDLFGSDNPLEEVASIPIGKVEHYEKIPEPLDALSKRRKRKVQRTAAEISEVIRLHNKAIQDCYKQALRKNVSLKGKIVVRFSISPLGRVTDVTIVSSNLNNERMERCIVNRMRRWNDFGICETQKQDISLKQSYVFGY